MNSSTTNKLAIILCCLFFCVLATPMVAGFLTEDKSISAAEKRYLQPLPSWSESKSLKDYFASLSRYTNDQFGFREEIIQTFNKILWSFGQSPVSHVIRGKDDWLFLRVKDPLLTQHKHKNITIHAILQRRIDYADRMNTMLTERGVPYRHLVASNKMSVYSEHLPAVFKLTDVDATLQAFKQKIRPEQAHLFLFTDEVVAQQEAAGETRPLYFKNDTHWNDLGAYRAFQAVLQSFDATTRNKLFSPPEHGFGKHTKYSGDLAQYVGLNEYLRAEEPYVKIAECARPSNAKKLHWNVSLSSCNVNNTKALLIGDSFMTNFYTYVSESVGHVYLVKQKISRIRLQELIDEYQPDVVIEEVVERSLAEPIPK